MLHKTLSVAEGAQIEGMCKRLDASAVAQVGSSAPTTLAPLAHGDTKPLADRRAAIS